MPEGDTVWRAAHRMHQALAGQALTGCDFRVPEHATADLSSWTVDQVVSRGKHLLHRFRGPAGAGVSLHRHPYAETFMVRKGRVSLMIGDETVEGREGQIFVVPAGVPRRMPDGSSGARVSNGIMFLFTVMPAASRACSAILPVTPFDMTSTRIR